MHWSVHGTRPTCIVGPRRGSAVVEPRRNGFHIRERRCRNSRIIVRSSDEASCSWEVQAIIAPTAAHSLRKFSSRQGTATVVGKFTAITSAPAITTSAYSILLSVWCTRHGRGSDSTIVLTIG